MSQDNKPLFVTNPEVWLQKENEAHAFVCIVIFRDSWCKFDKHHFTALGKHNESHMKQEQVYLIAWTSEGAEGAAKTDAEWNLTCQLGYDEVLGDETGALAKHSIETHCIYSRDIS